MEDQEHASDSLIGQLIGDRYRVDAMLGEGGMGTVFRCRHLALDRDVAVKLLHPELLENEQISARFDREARSTSRLEHPNVLQVLDFGTWVRPDSGAEAKYMVLSLLTGHELADILDEPQAPGRVVDFGLQIVRGLEHAHSRGIVHRDLKPENVFVTVDHEGEEQLKILDFGLALMLSASGDEQRLTRVGMVFGTPQYMSPEQATGGESDERTDIYALGIMLWELLAGHAPFDGDDAVAILRKQVSVELPNEELPESTPPALVELICAMTQKSVADRMATATEVRNALETLRAGGLVEAPAEVVPVATAPEASSVALEASAEMSKVAKVRSATIMQLPLQVSESLATRFKLPLNFAMGIVASGTLIVVVTIGLALSGDSGESAESGAQLQSDTVVAAPWNFSGGLLANPAPPEAIAELDKAIEARDDATALAKLDALLAEYADDVRLHAKRGLVLSRQEGKQRAALEAFARALELDANISNDENIYRALLDVLRDPAVVSESVEFALARLGERGHDFLIELVNRDEHLLSHVDRHRVMTALAQFPDKAARIDLRLNNSIDLWQAELTARPCKDYASALTVIEADPHAFYVGSLYYSRAPKGADAAKDGKNGGAAGDCEGLDERRGALAAAFAEKFPEADKTRELPKEFESRAKKRKKKKGKKRFRLFQ